MTLFRFCILISALIIAVLPAAAWDGVEVVDSSGSLRKEIYAAPTPTPGYCYWDKDEFGGPAYHATNADGYGNTGCPSPWLVHCDNDSLVFWGTWPLIDGLYVLSSSYNVALSCSVEISVDTRLSASRAVVGNLDIDEHTLTIGFPDGAEVQLLAPGSGPDQAQLDLPPGNYRITLTVSALQSKTTQTEIDPYEGQVLLKWEDPAGVAVEPLSWSSLKAGFR